MKCDKSHLKQAARIALRGHGRAEPNPLVGCVIADPDGNVITDAYHARCGEAHAERIALKRAGQAAHGSTLYTTLEPCTHHGRTPPCTDAIIDAGVARVVFGTADPNELAAGGAVTLRAHGIEVEHLPTRATDLLNAAYLHRVGSGLPWIVAKWAQTLDGRIATSTGDSRWISSNRSRRLVHRERGRVDAIITGIGTVLADNPQLTARDVRRPRRTPARIIIDDQLDTPSDCTLIQTAKSVPTILLCQAHMADSSRADSLRTHGAIIEPLGERGAITPAIARISQSNSWATILVEAGGGTTGRLFKEGLVNEALVFIAPKLLGDADAPSAVRGMNAAQITDGITLDPIAVFPRQHDIVAWYRPSEPSTASSTQSPQA